MSCGSSKRCARAPEVFVTCAHELISRMGEYERTAAVAINCFIGATSARYIARLEKRELGYKFPLLIMQCSGGVTPAVDAIERPLFTIDLGPAGGVMGAKFLADTLGHRNAIATDVGGTRFDVGLIHEGVALTTSEATYNQYTFYSPRIRSALDRERRRQYSMDRRVKRHAARRTTFGGCGPRTGLLWTRRRPADCH